MIRIKINRNIISLVLLFLLDALAPAATFWISDKGGPGGDGSQNNPFNSINTALQKKGGGNTYIFKPGVYTGQITLKSVYKGTPKAPTILQSEQKYKAILHGSIGHAVYIDKGADWVIVDGFEARCAAIDGIKSNANFTVIRNCWIHHNCENGIGAFSVEGGVYERNLVEFNGTHIQFTHGLYIHGENLIIRQNIVRFNASHGIHLYPEISGTLVENNLIYGNTRSGIIMYCPSGGGSNKIINNTIVDNGYGICIKKGKGEIIVNNILAGNNRRRNGVKNSVIELIDTEMKNIRFENNMIYPKEIIAEPNNIFLDPRFVNPEKGIFFLKPDSPAIKKSNLKYAPRQDFWSRQILKDTPLDLGCFSFNEAVLKGDYRKGWYYDWPFFFKEGTGPLPDLWAVPNN